MAAAEAAPAPAPEASDFYGGGGGLSTGRKLVPWSSWTEWRFVRDGLFSPFPAAALRRIAAWRSRGSLPIPVDVTAAFVEIRLRDPFFRADRHELRQLLPPRLDVRTRLQRRHFLGLGSSGAPHSCSASSLPATEFQALATRQQQLTSILQLEKHLKDQQVVRGALEKALGPNAAQVNLSPENPMPKAANDTSSGRSKTKEMASLQARPYVKTWWEELAARPAAKKVAEFMPLGAGATKKQG